MDQQPIDEFGQTYYGLPTFASFADLAAIRAWDVDDHLLKINTGIGSNQLRLETSAKLGYTSKGKGNGTPVKFVNWMKDLLVASCNGFTLNAYHGVYFELADIREAGDNPNTIAMKTAWIDKAHQIFHKESYQFYNTLNGITLGKKRETIQELDVNNRMNGREVFAAFRQLHTGTTPMLNKSAIRDLKDKVNTIYYKGSIDNYHKAVVEVNKELRVHNREIP